MWEYKFYAGECIGVFYLKIGLNYRHRCATFFEKNKLLPPTILLEKNRYMQNNPLLDNMNEQVEKLKTAKDISEIEQLLITYQQTGYLGKDKAIKKICEARAKEIVVEVALMPKSPSTTVFYENASDSQLASALSFVLQYLTGKAMVKGIENQNGVPHC